VVEPRRYQVFVSSTFLDLQEERAAVVSALLQMEAFPAGMELFPAADDDAWTLIKRVIGDSDYYLLVIGGKYGSIDPGTELSFTEKEYDYAVERGKPVLAFLHADPEKIEFGKSEKDKTAREKLEAFRAKVETKKHVKYWAGPDDLAGKVALSFASFRQSYSATGWIRGDVGTSAEALGEINDLRKQLAEAEAKSEGARKGPPEEAKDLAQGDEPVDFTFTARVVARTESSLLNSITLVEDLDIEITWNDLFWCVGPEMLNESDEQSLRIRINSWLHQEYKDFAVGNAQAEQEAEGDEIRQVKKVSITMTDEDFSTLIVQFRALGLIEKSERNRSVKDTKTYWALTPYGDDHLTTLRAIPRHQEVTEGDSDESDTKEVTPVKKESALAKRSDADENKMKDKTKAG
jgi:hypothetical protein